jgi:very-short-patch-repair endonuclease
LLGGRSIAVAGASPGERLNAVATAQHGRISRDQLLAIGFTDGRIRTLVANHVLVRLHRNVYAVGHLAAVPLGAETAALLAFRSGVALSHRSALRVMGVLPAEPGAVVEVIVRSDRGHHRRAGVTVHRTGWLPQSHLRLVSGLPTTAAERALLDVAPSMSTRELERAVDEALALRVTSLTKLHALESVAGFCGSRGSGRLTRLLNERSGLTVTHSEAEERFLALIRSAELPMPELQAYLHGFSLDFYWPQARFAVEIDGFRWHTTKTNFERDRRKDTTLLAQGVEVARISWSQLAKEPLRLVALVSGQLSARQRLAG